MSVGYLLLLGDEICIELGIAESLLKLLESQLRDRLGVGEDAVLDVVDIALLVSLLENLPSDLRGDVLDAQVGEHQMDAVDLALLSGVSWLLASLASYGCAVGPVVACMDVSFVMMK